MIIVYLINSRKKEKGKTEQYMNLSPQDKFVKVAGKTGGSRPDKTDGLSFWKSRNDGGRSFKLYENIINIQKIIHTIIQQ